MDAERYITFSRNYLPDLFNYVVPVVDGNEIASGVMVNVRGRHFVATAQHCIRHNPRVMRSEVRLEQNRIVQTRALRVIGRGWHDSLDIGYLEVEDAIGPELGWDQLSGKCVVEGAVHIIGYPEVLTQLDMSRKNVSLCVACFGTSVMEQTDEFLKLDYPKEGLKPNDAGELVKSEFPEHPRGFSGGGCFGVSSSTSDSGIEKIEYHLLGVQYEWHKGERWVKVVPIKRWCDLLTEKAFIGE